MKKAITHILNREGVVTAFDRSRIEAAIFKAVRAVGGKDKTPIPRLTDQVIDFLITKYIDNSLLPTIEDIQDSVEKILIENRHARVAKAYILYRRQHTEAREVSRAMVDVKNAVDEYAENASIFGNENANSTYSFSGLTMDVVGKIMHGYVFSQVYSDEMKLAHVDGDFHIHDLQMGIVGYCAGWSLRELLAEGFNGVRSKVSSGPARHFGAALMQIVNFFGTLQNEWAGAQAFSSFDTYLAPYIRQDNLSYDEVLQHIQSFVFNLNVASRWGGQTPFTNLTFDLVVPDDMKNQNVIWGGEVLDTTYADYQIEMDMINKAFMEVMLRGDDDGKLFSFPIPTYNITKDFNWDSEISNLLFDMTAKFGIPNFQNFVNSDLNPSDVRSMCCRLQLDLRELRNKTGGLFGSGEKTGSIGVVTINLPRIGYTALDDADYFEKLTRLMVLAKDSLEIKRELVKKNFDRGLLPYTKRYLHSLDSHFSTIGLVGLNESVKNYLGEDIATPNGKAFAEKVLRFMRETIAQFQEETGHIYNLEATPAEGTTHRLARLDKDMYPEIYTQGTTDPYYTNSSQLPVNYSNDIFEVLSHQDVLQSVYNGGTILHVFVGEQSPDREATKSLVKYIVSHHRIPNFTITPEFSICETHGYHAGRHEVCPVCGARMLVYSRVTGYYRPVESWNRGKKEEFKDRLRYDATPIVIPESEVSFV